MSGETDEVILAQEQGAMMRAAGAKNELEAEFGAAETEGTLVLTNKRLVFVCTDEKEDDLPVSVLPTRLQEVRVLYSDVEDIDDVPRAPPNMFVNLTSVSSARGHRGGLGRPSLEVEWSDKEGKHAYVFTEVLTGRRKRNLNDWAPIIENLKAGRQRLVAVPRSPPIDTLEGKVTHALADMQEKGLFVIEEEIEREFKVELDPDDVQTVCDKLSSEGALLRLPDPSGDVFYRRLSPLGDEDPSS